VELGDLCSRSVTPQVSQWLCIGVPIEAPSSVALAKDPPRCSRFCSCRMPPASTGIHRFQQGGRISLERKHLKIGDFGQRPETALGSVDPPYLFLFIFNHLQNNPVEP